MISLLFVIVAPIVPVARPAGVFAQSFQYDCPPGHNRAQGLPNPFYAMAISYAVFKVGFIYYEQLNPPLALETASTIHMPCRF
jgi:hypothetical protein